MHFHVFVINPISLNSYAILALSHPVNLNKRFLQQKTAKACFMYAEIQLRCIQTNKFKNCACAINCI